MQDNECNGFGCKWIQNRHDADNWVCLKCGKDQGDRTKNNNR